jgi:SAM-dependent methyltransferase
MTMAREMKQFWDNCSPELAHLEMENQDKVVIVDWTKEFLVELENRTNLKDKTIIDYGTGAGQLGIHMHYNYGISKYIGIDISQRQLTHVRNRIISYNEKRIDEHLEYETYEPGKKLFSDMEADVFISQATIQHFPDIDYLDKFLAQIDKSKIQTVVLQYRFNGRTEVTNYNYQDPMSVCFKCYTTMEYIESKLSNYDLVWEGRYIEEILGQYIILQHKV